MEVSDFGEDPSNAKTLVTCKKREFELSTEQLTSEISYPREIHINIYAQAAASILLLRFLFLLVFLMPTHLFHSILLSLVASNLTKSFRHVCIESQIVVSE